MSYVIPVAKNNVYFTRNLTEKNRKAGEVLLGYYWRDSKISKAPYYPITNWNGMLNFLSSNYPTYIESLGDLMNTVPMDKLIAAMKEAAKLGRTEYPRPSVFAQAIINNTGYSLGDKIGDIAEAVSDTVVDLSKMAFWLSVVGLLVVGYIEFGPMLKVMFRKAKAV